MRELVITAHDREWHEVFHEYVGRVFPGVSFRDWQARGGWQEDYRVFALIDGNRMVAGAGLTRMELVLHGRDLRGWQLGAVGTDPDHRGRGLQRRVLQRALAHPPADDLMFLFANDTVLDFYPRFGFRRARECVFTAPHRAEPARPALPQLRPDRAADRALVSRIASHARPTTEVFGARGYASIVLWYFCNFHREHVRYVPEHDALIVSEQVGATLSVYDVLAQQPFELATQLPGLIQTPIERVEFLYSPERDWPTALATRDYVDSPLFFRGPHRLPQQSFKFPILAQT